METTDVKKQTKNTSDHCVGCNCSWGAYQGYGVRRFLVLALAMLLAFWLGMKLGEIKGYMHTMYKGGYDHREMMMVREPMMNTETRMPLVSPITTPPAPVAPTVQ